MYEITTKEEGMSLFKYSIHGLLRELLGEFRDKAFMKKSGASIAIFAYWYPRTEILRRGLLTLLGHDHGKPPLMLNKRTLSNFWIYQHIATDMLFTCYSKRGSDSLDQTITRDYHPVWTNQNLTVIVASTSLIRWILLYANWNHWSLSPDCFFRPLNYIWCFSL